MFASSVIIRKLFFSFLFLLIPWVLVSTSFTYVTLTRLKSGTDDAIAFQLGRVQQEFESKYSSLRDSSVLLAAQPELLRFKMLSDNINAAKGIERLEIINAYDEECDDIFLSFGTGKLYSSRGMTREDAYFNETLSCDRESALLGMKAIEGTAPAVTYLDKKSGPGYLLYHYPLRGATDTSVNFCMRFSVLTDMLAALVKEYPAYLTITFEDGRVLYFNGSMKNGIQYLADTPEKEFGSEFMATSVDLASFQAELKVYYHSMEIYKNAIYLLAVNILLTATMLIISIFISYRQSKLYYSPIRQLASTVRAIAPEHMALPNERANEFDYIQGMLNRVAQESGNLEQKMQISHSILKQQTATLLFQGLIRDEVSAEQMMRLCGVERNENFFTLTGILLKEKTEDQKQVYNKFEAVLKGDLYAETTLNGQPALIIFTEMSHKDYVRQSRLETAKALIRILETMDAKEIHIGFSQIYENLSMASYAYLEVTSVLEKPFLQPIEFWENAIEGEVLSIQLEESDIRAFEHSLEIQEADQALQILHKMQTHIASHHFSEESCRYLRYCILQPLILHVKNGRGKTEKDLLEVAMRIDPSNPQAFQMDIVQLIKRICKPAESSQDFEKIVHYINQNYAKFDLSLEEVAAYAGFSKTYLSKLFRQKTGYRYIDYLTQLRMEKARVLLEHTDLPIKEIVTAVGYYDVAGFRKKFKAIYGINASEHRKQSEEKEDSD